MQGKVWEGRRGREERGGNGKGAEEKRGKGSVVETKNP